MEIPPKSPAIRWQGRQTLEDEGETRLGEDYSEVSTHAQGWRSMQLEYYQLERLHLSAHRWEHLKVLLYLKPVDSLLFQVRDRWEACEVRPGHFSIHPQPFSYCPSSTTHPVAKRRPLCGRSQPATTGNSLGGIQESHKR